MARIGVQILGDSTSLERAFKRSEVAATTFNARMNTLGQTTRGAFAGAGFNKGSLLFGSTAFVGASIGAAAITKSVQAASDLNEQITKSQQVFGESAREIRQWSETTAASFGVSQNAALEATGTFGNLFRTVELAPKASAEMSRALTELAADLASFNNANIDDVLLAIRSGLIGEAEPLRRYGVLLSETRVQQEALAESGKNNVKALTDQEKALARYNIILQDTVPAQGDFARTSDGLANQTRILKANLNNLAANLGTVLLPTITEATEAANLLFIALDKFRGVDFSPGFDFPDPPSWLTSGLALAPVSPLGAAAVTLNNIFGDDKKEIDALGKVGADVNSSLAKLAAAMDKRAKTLAKINKSNAAADTKRFAETLKGLELKLDKAALSDNLDRQIAVLREQEQAILKREAKVGKKFELEVTLTAVRQQIKDLQEDKQNAALREQQEREQKILDLKEKQKRALDQQLARQKEIAAEAKRALDAAEDQARSLFGTLFQIPDEARRAITVLGGSKGAQTVVLPGAGGGEDARGLLADLSTQIKSFKTLQASILELQRKGAPASLLEAARSGQISADQVNALAKANSSTLNQIFKNVRLADKLVSRAAKAEIHAKDVSLRANTVTVRGALAASGGGGARESGFTVNGGIHLHGVQNVKQLENELERRRKKRTQQTRGRAGGKR